MAARAKAGEIAESCLDLLTLEAAGALAARPELHCGGVEAVGFQVGQQLAERWGAGGGEGGGTRP